jgi:O-antigen/teichoic acid export membrane protein
MAEPRAQPPGSKAIRWPKAAGGVFVRHVVTLASGTAIAQLLFVLAMPVLSRLYTPSDYGTLAVYSSTLTVLLVLASLRYEAAIPLPEDEEVAGSLLALTLLVLAAMAVLLALLVWLAGDAFVARANVAALRPYLWLIPVGLLGAGTHQALAYWAIRRRAFGRIARTSLRAAAGRYRRFPLLTTWSGLLNVGSLQLPSILFSASFGAAAAGLYALSYKMLVLPTMLVGQASARCSSRGPPPCPGSRRPCAGSPSAARSRSSRAGCRFSARWGSAGLGSSRR